MDRVYHLYTVCTSCILEVSRWVTSVGPCLSSMVTEWLKRNYNVKKFGEPTWQWLVEAVGDPAGGANTALARKIGRRHKAEDGTVTIKTAGRSRSAGEASLKAAAMKLARKCKSESEANSEITEQGANTEGVSSNTT